MQLNPGRDQEKSFYEISFSVSAYSRTKRASPVNPSKFPFDVIGKSRKIDLVLDHVDRPGVLIIVSACQEMPAKCIGINNTKDILSSRLELPVRPGVRNQIEFWIHVVEIRKSINTGFFFFDLQTKQTIKLFEWQHLTANHHWESQHVDQEPIKIFRHTIKHPVNLLS